MNGKKNCEVKRRSKQWLQTNEMNVANENENKAYQYVYNAQ